MMSKLDLYNMTYASPRGLVERGFKIFPIAKGGKFPPMVNDWPTKATADLAVIEKWGGRFPGCNWGIHCDGLLVVDIDLKKPEARDSLDYLNVTVKSAPAFPKTLASLTPSGGYHYFYRCDEGVPNSVNKLGSGLDIRSTNGYVVAPGSTVAGAPYKWVTNYPIAPAPEWLVTKAREKIRTSDAKAPPPDNVNVYAAMDRAKALLKETRPAIEGQGGDAHTYVVVCKVRDVGVPRDRAIEALYNWNERCEPPWSHEELKVKIQNAYQYAQNPAGVDSDESWFEPVQSPALFKNNEQAKKVDTEMFGPDDVQLSEVLSTEYLVKGWIERERQCMMFGKWGGGKTFCALHMAAHVAAGEPWFGNRVRQGGVLYVGYEGQVALKRRLVALRQEFPEYDMGAFKVLPMRWPLVSRGDGGHKLVGQERLEKALNAFKQETGAYPALLVVDPLRNALGGSDSDADLTSPYLAYLQRLTKLTGCATLTLHHPGHSDNDRGRGDSGIEAHMDAVLKLDGKLHTIEATKQRDDPRGTLYYRLDTLTLGSDVDGDPITTCIVRHIPVGRVDPQTIDSEEMFR